MPTNADKPKLNLPVTVHERLLNTLTFLTIACGIVYLLMQWSSLPDRIPIHFNGKGEADGWGSKWTLTALPLIGVVLCAGMALLSRYPHHYNYPVRITMENAARQYLLSRKMLAWVNLALAVTFVWIEWQTVDSANGGSASLGWAFVLFLMAVIFGIMGIYLVRASKLK
ncbi:DUF1648 domain-containing protein [Cohnella boryungensis]|uniref:DUF1648 domain-containing protein n=1 Tax=Cohnella boryungensis TaxID=768479 RepID=A0ABV8SL09_9BACL